MRIGTRVEIIAKPERRVIGTYTHNGEVVTVLEDCPLVGLAGVLVARDAARPAHGETVLLDDGRIRCVTPAEIVALAEATP